PDENPPRQRPHDRRPQLGYRHRGYTVTRRLTDFAAGLISLAVLAVLTVLPPLLLTRHVGWPLPTMIPSLAEMEQSVRTGIDPQVTVKALALVAWIAWAQVAGAVLVETAALLRRRSAPNLR